MSPKVMLKSSTTPSIQVLTGPDKGSSIPLSSPILTIGRSDDNDIKVSSDGVSRNHAKIITSEEGVLVKDNGSKNGILVNGKAQTEMVLRDGDVVQVGDFAFRYSSVAVEEASQGVESVGPVEEAPLDGVSPKRRRASGPPNKRVLLYTALILFLGGAYYLAQGDDKGKKPAESQELKAEVSSVAVAPVIDATPKYNPPPLSPEMKRAEEVLSKLDWSDTSVKTAEDYFRRGAREYSNQNYHRAIEAFQTALQIDKNHVGAKKYLSWAVQEAELEARKNRDIGIRYYESLQYQRAIHHFHEVIALMAHRPLDPMVAQAEKYIQLAKRALEAADYFP
ncbi:MAG: FHA domain-containing protein [Deltaproteobacteria bacterium]|nr:FHA domain-containing protein [Deltaproteobacteria bacterium]MBI3296492.1 FHA domain-containing protein [Deltaproteobacteria bacterium]